MPSAKVRLGRWRRDKPGQIEKPQVLSEAPGGPDDLPKIIFRLPGDGYVPVASSGHWLAVRTPATRAYVRADGAYVLEAYYSTREIWVPGSVTSVFKNMDR